MLLFIHSTIDDHLSCLHYLVIINSAGMNIPVYVSWCIYVCIRE